MKILFVNHLLDLAKGGGTAERTFQLARHMALTGNDCSILTLDIGITDERLASLGFAKLVAVPCRNERFFVPLIARAELDRLVSDADVVHLSGHWTLLNARVFAACRRLRKPYLFCPAGALKPFGRSLLLKWIYDVIVGNRIISSAESSVAITSDERADLLARGVPSERIAIIPNGIDQQDYVLADPADAIAKFRSMYGLGTASFVLFLGRLNAIKGPDLLLEAFANIAGRFPEHHLVFAGPDGGMQEALAAHARKIGLAQRVHFIGFVSGPTKVAALLSASLLAIPSRFEAMSIVVLESGACGCPVLFTSTCGLVEIARARAGIVVEPNTLAISAGLERSLAYPQELADTANRLNKIVLNDYLWLVQGARYEILASKVLAEAR